jgi:uncharacterized protein (TIGR01741 family)
MDNIKMELIYNDIAEKTSSIIPVEWKRAIIYSEIEDESNQTYFYFTTASDKLIYCLDIPELFDIEIDKFDELMFALEDSLEKLHKEFNIEGLKEWTSITFSINSDGQFNIEYGYNDLKEQDSYEQQIIWKYEKLGIYPDEKNKRDIEIIENHKKGKRY